MKIKRFLLFIILLCLAAALFAASGRIGGSLKYHRYYNASMTEVQSQAIMVAAEGANFFDERNIFGLGYGMYYEYPFGDLRSIDQIGFTVKSLFNLDVSRLIAFEFSAGLYDKIYINEISANEIGMNAGLGLCFSPNDSFEVSLGINYNLPFILGYKDVVKPVGYDAHSIDYGISFSYLY